MFKNVAEQQSTKSVLCCVHLLNEEVQVAQL